MKITTKQSEKNLFVPVELTITFESRNEILGMLAYMAIDDSDVPNMVPSSLLDDLTNLGYNERDQFAFKSSSVYVNLFDLVQSC